VRLNVSRGGRNIGSREEAKVSRTALRRLREERGLSQSDLARRAPQVSLSTIKLLDRGVHKPNAKTMIHLARALGVEPGELMEGMEVPIA
jgi:transcriptional regulator with XRE-family HTH domain